MWDNSNETKRWDDWTEQLGFTVATCFGNHCNFPAIRALPLEDWNGGKVHKVRPHVMYLENGEVFNINGFKFFIFGGATSVDRAFRREGKTWFPEEIPSREEMQHAADTLERNNFNVDYILSHCAPSHIVDKLFPYELERAHDDVTNFLEKYVVAQATFKGHFMGHYHLNKTYENKYHILYNDIIELLPDGTIKIVN